MRVSRGLVVLFLVVNFFLTIISAIAIANYANGLNDVRMLLDSVLRNLGIQLPTFEALYLLAVSLFFSGAGSFFIGYWVHKDGGDIERLKSFLDVQKESRSEVDKQAILSEGKLETLRCPECRKELQYGFKHCPYCGFELKEKNCPQCGKEAEKAFTFCPDCGYRLSEAVSTAAPSLPEATIVQPSTDSTTTEKEIT